MKCLALLLASFVVILTGLRASEPLPEPAEKLVWNLADHEAATGAKWRTVSFPTVPGLFYELQSSPDLETWTSDQSFYGLGHTLDLTLFELEEPPPPQPGDGPVTLPPPRQHVTFLVRPAHGGGIVLSWRSLANGDFLHKLVAAELDPAWDRMPLYWRNFGDYNLFVGAWSRNPAEPPPVVPLSAEDTAAAAVFTDNFQTMNAEVAANVELARLAPPPPPPDPGGRKFYRLGRTVLDSDGDGVPDWYELRDLHTDPFLADSDGDGSSDGEELDQLTDANDETSGNAANRGLSAEEVFRRTTYAGLPLPGSNPVGMTSGGQVVLDGGYSVWNRGTMIQRDDPVIDVTWTGHGLVQPVDFMISSRVVNCIGDEDGLADDGVELDDLPESVVRSGLERQYEEDEDFVGLQIISMSQLRRGSHIAADGSVLGSVVAFVEVEIERLASLDEGETETVKTTENQSWCADMVLWNEGGSGPRIPQCYSSLPLHDSWPPGITVVDYSGKGGILAYIQGRPGLSWCSGPSSGQWYPAQNPRWTPRLEEHGPLGTTGASHSSMTDTGILRLGSGLRWTSFEAQNLDAISRHGVVAGMEVATYRPTLWKSFSGSGWVPLNLNDACGLSTAQSGIGGRIFLSDDGEDSGAPERVLVANGPDGNAALLVKTELVGVERADAAHEDHDWATVDARPRPEVRLQIDGARVQGGPNGQELKLEVSGWVRDRLSSFATGAAGRVTQLELSVFGQILATIPVTENVGTQFEFQSELVIPNVSAGAFTLRATTGPNGAGRRGWDQAAVSIALIPAPMPGNRADLTLALSQVPDGTAADSFRLFFGNRQALATDGTVTEDAADSHSYAGTLKALWEDAETDFACTILAVPQGPFSTTAKDRLGVEMRYTLPDGRTNSIQGFWEETAADSLLFRSSGITTGDEVLAVSGIHPMAGSQKEEAAPLTLRTWLPEGWEGSNGLKFGIGDTAFELRPFPETGSQACYPAGPVDGPRFFLPAEGQVPAALAVPGYTGGGGEIELRMGFGEDLDVVGSITVLPGEDASPEFAPPPEPENPPAPDSTPGWRQPGDTVTWDDLMTAYEFIYGQNEEAMLLLDAYLSRGNHISLEDEGGDLNVSYMMRTDGKILMQIEHDDDDIHPAACASLLYAGLHRALAYPPLNTHPEIVSDPDFFHQSRQAFAEVASEMTVTAAELYLSGISIANEGLDWILVINDVAEGHYESLAATLPFVSSGMVKSAGAFLLIKNLGGETLEALDREALEALVQTARNPDLDIEIIGELVEQHGMKDVVRKILTTDGGPIKPPFWRSGLKSNMKRALHGGPPSGFVVHHDFIWVQRGWFAQHGIDVNDALFGRYVQKAEHKQWHSGIGFGRGGRFNKFWNDVLAAEKLTGGRLTRLEILQKLAECREQFPVTILPP